MPADNVTTPTMKLQTWIKSLRLAPRLSTALLNSTERISYGEAAALLESLVSSSRTIEPQEIVAVESLSVDAATVQPLVLVVDDSLTVRRIVQRLLVREGYRVALAKDGLDAMERLSQERPSMVLADIEMPRMDGFDLLRTIRNDAQFRDLPVIIITSHTTKKHRSHATKLGANYFLGKPFLDKRLLALVERHAVEPTSAKAAARGQ